MRGISIFGYIRTRFDIRLRSRIRIRTGFLIFDPGKFLTKQPRFLASKKEVPKSRSRRRHWNDKRGDQKARSEDQGPSVGHG